MKFVELKKSLIDGRVFGVFNLCGEDSFLIDSSKNLFWNYVIHQNELSRSILSAESLTVGKLDAVLNTSSFLGGQKVVFLNDLQVAKNKDIAKYVVEYAKSPAPQTVLVVTTDTPIFEAKKDAKKIDELNKTGNNFAFVDCNRLDRRMLLLWIQTELKANNQTMQYDATNLLIDYTNGYLSIIAKELEKLMAYAQNREITSQDVQKLVKRELEFGVFELTECLGKGDSKRTFEILQDMMSETKTAQSVFGMIERYFRRMFFVSITPKTNAQIAGLLGVKEYAVSKAKQSASLFSKVALKSIVELCGELDFLVRSSKMPYKDAVDYLVFFILNSGKKIAG